MREIRIYSKGEFEDWESARALVFHGEEIDRERNRDLYEFVEDLLIRTHYSDFALTRIYKTIEKGFVCLLYKQTQNEYGGYVGSVQIYITIDDIARNMERGGE
jgi:hypothetical protein